ncbi:acyl-CoA dehydrogenase family protein [Pseudochelatococcus sp. B33]
MNQQVTPAIAGLSFHLTEEQLRLRDLARKFAYEEVRPQALKLDPIVDPAEIYPIDLIRRASALGLRTLKIPREYGGLEVDTLTEVLVLEELAAGDGGFAMLIQHPWREGAILAGATTPEQRERFLPEFLADDTYMTSYALTEPHAGSDHSIPYAEDLEAGPQTTAVLDGDEWVLNGTKRYITNVNNSKVIILFARTDKTVPWNEGFSLFLVSTSAPGVRVERLQDKIGLRLNPNGDIVFENCRIPRTNLLGEINRGSAVVHRFGRGTKVKGAARAVGIARSAFEEAIAWVRQRKQGGKLLIEHQAIAHTIADLARQIEMARTLNWRAAWAVDNDPEDAPRLEAIAKITATNLVADVSRRALELFGGYGVGRGTVIEKITRDAATMLHAPAGNDAFRENLARIIQQKHRGDTPLKTGH